MDPTFFAYLQLILDRIGKKIIIQFGNFFSTQSISSLYFFLRSLRHIRRISFPPQMNQYEYRYIFKLFPPDFLIYPMSARTWPATTIAFQLFPSLKWTLPGLILASIKACLMIDEPTNHTLRYSPVAFGNPEYNYN